MGLGIHWLVADADERARLAFRIANLAVARALRRRAAGTSGDPAAIDPPVRRPFQLAFILLAVGAQVVVVDRGATASPAKSLPAILPSAELDALTIPDIQERMSAGDLSSTALTLSYLARIREVDDDLRAVLAVNPLALMEAATSDLLAALKASEDPAFVRDAADYGLRLGFLLHETVALRDPESADVRT